MTTIDAPQGPADHDRPGPRHSAWLDVTQERIDTFADATDDHQWIHVDVGARQGRALRRPDRARLPHAVAADPALVARSSSIEELDMAVNYGLNKVRFPAPVPAGSRVQVSATLADAEEVGGNGIQATIDTVMRVEGADKPVCIAQMVHRYYKADPMTHAYDPELAPWAPIFAQLSFADIPAARAGEADLLAALPPYEPPVPLDVDELLVPGPEGAPEVRVRRYRPADHDGPLPGAGLLPRRRLRRRQPRPVRRRLPPDRRRGRCRRGLRRLPPRAGAPVPGPARGLLRRPGLGGRATPRSSAWTPTGSRSAARAPAAAWRPASPCWPATVAVRGCACSSWASPSSTTGWTPSRCARSGRQHPDHHARERRDQLGQLPRAGCARDRPGLAVRRSGARHRPRRAAARAGHGLRVRRAPRRGHRLRPAAAVGRGADRAARLLRAPSTPARGSRTTAICQQILGDLIDGLRRRLHAPVPEAV